MQHTFRGRPVRPVRRRRSREQVVVDGPRSGASLGRPGLTAVTNALFEVLATGARLRVSLDEATSAPRFRFLGQSVTPRDIAVSVLLAQSVRCAPSANPLSPDARAVGERRRQTRSWRALHDRRPQRDPVHGEGSATKGEILPEDLLLQVPRPPVENHDLASR